tara:strand:+ start:857 stop:1015 length:159 start_codon:yes stop_codon:yes gene_type:complete
MGPGPLSILVILLIVLVVFGAKRIRTLGSDLGKSVKGFKKEMKEDNDPDRDS